MKLRFLVWLTTAAALVAFTVTLPRLSPLTDHDPFPARLSVGSTVHIADGTVHVTGVRAAPQWTSEDETYSLTEQGGVFVELRAVISPDRAATPLRAVLVSRGRTYSPSDRVSPYNDPAEPGFETDQVIVFEVPQDALADGAVLVHLAEGADARLGLDDVVEHVAELEEVE